MTIWRPSKRVKDLNSVTDFVRLLDYGNQRAELQTAVVTYKRRFPFSLFHRHQVDLVGAIHIADKEYFSSLQEDLSKYDRVLYEMIVGKDKSQTNRLGKNRWRPKAYGPHGSHKVRVNIFPVTILQTMACLLALESQADCMDYSRENFYHADLDKETFRVLQQKKGESYFTRLKDKRSNMVTTDKTEIQQTLELDAWAMFKELNIRGAFKVFLAQKLVYSNCTDDASPAVKNSVLIGERNRVAMAELQAAFQEGCSKVAVFYGCGHLPDMDRRLREEFNLYPTTTNWRTAWTMRRHKRIVKDTLETPEPMTMEFNF